MKTLAIQRLRQKLRAGQPAFGLWITLESPSITEMAVALGLDWVVIDAEHGHLDWQEIVEHLRATVRSDTVALVRVTECNIGLIKRALDLGADGILIPWVETAEQLRHAVELANFPPVGVRGIGGERATAWGQCLLEHAQEANDNVLVVPIIETVRGGKNIQEMLKVAGVEMFFFGPADYSSSAGFAGQWQGPGVAEQILAVKEQIRAAGKHCGVMGKSDADLAERQGQGFQVLGLGSDCSLLLRSLHATLASIGRDRKLNPRLEPRNEASRTAPLARPPESFRPDRPEVMTDRGKGNKVEVQPGVVFECLVRHPQQAKRLTTGVVQLDPNIKLARHTHPCTESITLLRGSTVVEVEGRRYRLAPLDNVVVPRGLAHAVENLSPERPAEFHIAFPTDAPTREFVEPCTSAEDMPDDSRGPGLPGLERVNRIRSAERCNDGLGTTFVDFFNDELMPGIEMSGGYGLFLPGGRLPAHVHDFEESICIVEGTAGCVVEGRRYKMTGFATALQPRGRVHYFTNETDQPMAMIWVYAGPKPERLVVDEQNATADGNPWR